MASIVRNRKLIEILQGIDPKGEMFAQILPDGRLVVGPDPFKPQTAVDFGSEQAVALRDGETVQSPSSTLAESLRQRIRTSYDFEIKGQVIRSNSLKDVLRHGLVQLERLAPGTLEKLSKIKPRSKRIVAHNPHELFETQNLVKDFSEKLSDGWWFGTNNSAQETRAWLERAALCAGLSWGRDCSSNF